MPGRASIADALMAFCICGWVLVAFLVTSPSTRHWFVLPVFCCGVVIGLDTVKVIRGKLSVFDPVGFVGVIGFHFFFLAPLLHVYFDRWMRYIVPPPDWRDELGKMALVNLAGLVAYAGANAMMSARRRSRYRPAVSRWYLRTTKFRRWTAFALLLTAMLQGWVYLRFGGIRGYIASFEAAEGDFQGYGILFSVSESFPVIAMMGFVVWASRKDKKYTWPILGFVLIVYFLVAVLFGGMRGSRGNTIWAMFWAVGLIHFWIRPVPRKVLLIGASFLIAFMYLYGFYKAMGSDAFGIVTGESSVKQAEEASGRSFEGLLLGDLARSDVQAFLLYRLAPPTGESDYKYALGGTYINGATFMLPDSVWQNRPPGKRVVGTEALYGAGASEFRPTLSSRAYGLAGEGMLNFGPIIVPGLYALYGIAVGAAQRWTERIPVGDSRLLIAPFVTICAFYILVWDSGNLVYFVFKRGAIPIALVIFCSYVAGRKTQQSGSGTIPTSSKG